MGLRTITKYPIHFFIKAGHSKLDLWGVARSGEVHALGNMWYIYVKAGHNGLVFFFFGFFLREDACTDGDSRV